jgi:hypothetical protein
MEYRGKNYTIVQGVEADTWKWAVQLDEKTVKSGEAKTRAAATNAVWAIDKALAPKGKLTWLAFFIPESGLNCRGLGTFPIFPDLKPWREVLFWRNTTYAQSQFTVVD